MTNLLEIQGYHGDRDLVDIPETGEAIYDEPQDPDTEFARTLHRIWQEKGDFSQVSSNSLLEDQLRELNDDDKQSEPEDDQPRDDSLTANDVLELKQSVLRNLGDAQNELAVALDVVNLLLSDTPRHLNEEMQLPIPKQSLGVASIETTELTSYQALKKSKISITTKTESLQSAADIFERASTQIEQVNNQNDTFWSDCLSLRDNNWSLIPSSNIRESAFDLEKAAKDLKVSYAIDEASNEIKSVSTSSFDIKPSKTGKSKLNIPSRRSKRLKLSIINGSTVEICSPSKSSDNIDDLAQNENERITSLLDSLNNAQDASFDEDCFADLLTEANQIPIVITSSAEFIAIELDANRQLTLELVGEEEFIKDDENISVKCDVLLFGLKLLRLRSYRNRANDTNQVMKNLLDLIHYESFLEDLKSLFARMTNLLKLFNVLEAGYYMQKTHASDILGVFFDEKMPSIIGTQAQINFGRGSNKIMNLTLNSPNTVYVQSGQYLQRTTISQLKTLVFSDTEVALLNAIRGICSGLGNKSIWLIDEIDRCVIGKKAEEQISIRPLITDKGCDLIVHSINKQEVFSISSNTPVYNIELTNWLRLHVN
ncbi:hypothetical protein WALSEDRAFT_68076 [Wallemia mellicola CBS 633.66]|uniref:Mediator of RNA polymerase II transcription subunit 17 n=2 Tax=Wallemia mellicola TaxID=1708541 RepID=I4YF82_WALMC|nr:hypothetical protein WALSEDRAFT_68076 [Wallemia mellicola CBS 633.66]EIM22624.1 hypothetical protein WALSEDRAFT_68076 [Wallemia mellicola CBS 633.66]|eukprot:XP_006957290.1 hypothetical protein WALSEDRAFT_68076 [Wallemia mellicola CBS 633.66]